MKKHCCMCSTEFETDDTNQIICDSCIYLIEKYTLLVEEKSLLHGKKSKKEKAEKIMINNYIDSTVVNYLGSNVSNGPTEPRTNEKQSNQNRNHNELIKPGIPAGSNNDNDHTGSTGSAETDGHTEVDKIYGITGIKEIKNEIKSEITDNSKESVSNLTTDNDDYIDSSKDFN